MRTRRSNWRSPWITCGRRFAAHRGLDQRVDVVHVQAVARDLFAVGNHGQAGLAQLAHHGDVGDSGHFRDDGLHLPGFGFERGQVSAEDLHREQAFQAGFGFIHRVLGRLRVVENHAGKCRRFLLNRVDQFLLVVNRPLPDRVVVRLQPDVKFVVEKPGGIRAVVRTPQLVRHGSDLRKAAQNVADLRRQLGGFFKRDGVGSGGAHPQCAFVQVRHELGADQRNQQQRRRENSQQHRDRDGAIPQAPAQQHAVSGADATGTATLAAPSSCRAAGRRTEPATPSARTAAIRPARTTWCPPSAGTSARKVPAARRWGDSRR